MYLSRSLLQTFNFEFHDYIQTHFRVYAQLNSCQLNYLKSTTYKQILLNDIGIIKIEMYFMEDRIFYSSKYLLFIPTLLYFAIYH